MTRENTEKTVLITGAAGFIGSALTERLLREDDSLRIVGLDNMSPYYDPALKRQRIERIKDDRFVFAEGDLTGRAFLDDLFDRYHPDTVVHLAAQAGVRWSIEHPDDYIQSNIIGFYNILEACRHHPVKHLVYASSSSVYGDSDVSPFREDLSTDHPVSLYAATKKSGEVLAYSYAALYGIPMTGLRFFTVYGPWGRPDMAYFIFADRWLRGEKARLFNNGDCYRDFTYIDDITKGITCVLDTPPVNGQPHRIFNIGKGDPDYLKDFAAVLAEELIRAGVLPEDFIWEEHTEYVPMQKGDVYRTYADISAMHETFGYNPETDLRNGLRAFCRWYAEYCGGERT